MFRSRKNTEREFSRRLRPVAKEIARITSAGQDATTVVYTLEEYARQLEPWAQATAMEIVERSNRQNIGMWRELSGALSQKLETLASSRDAVAMAMEDLAAEGARLITSLPLETAIQVETAAQTAALTGARHESLVEYIESRGEVARSRAELIARTEVSRQTTILTQTRAVSIGSAGYIWRTADDGRVRPSHAAMDGQYVKWSEPPTLDGLTGHAGALPNCRCYPEPIV